MNEYKIIINGEVTFIVTYGSHEIAIRSIMNWYNYNTLFIVTDGQETKYFRNVKCNDEEKGFTDLIELDYNIL